MLYTPTASWSRSRRPRSQRGSVLLIEPGRVVQPRCAFGDPVGRWRRSWGTPNNRAPPWYGEGVAKRARKPASAGDPPPAPGDGSVAGAARRQWPRSRPHRPGPHRPRHRGRPGRLRPRRRPGGRRPVRVCSAPLVGLARYLVPFGLIGRRRRPRPRRPSSSTARASPSGVVLAGVGLLILLHVAKGPDSLPGRLRRRREGRRVARGGHRPAAAEPARLAGQSSCWRSALLVAALVVITRLSLKRVARPGGLAACAPACGPALGAAGPGHQGDGHAQQRQRG